MDDEQIRQAARKAAEAPGTLQTAYSASDTAHLARLAAEHERRAAEYRALAMREAHVSTGDDAA